MCGICGFNFSDKKLIKDMCNIIVHRGPDSSGVYVDNNISLGNRRLSIIDVSVKGKQPMTNQEGNLIITYNGEMYNFKDIKKDLQKKGYRFRSETDTEVILYAYQEYGPDCLKLFNGIFAFAIWDNSKKELFLARDHLGIKPLYYYFKNNNFIFASEIKSLLLHKDIKRLVNKETLNEIIRYAFPISGNTLIKDIKELKPGHCMLLHKNKIEIKSYWNLKIYELDKPFEYFVKKTKELIESSVIMQLISDVPLGVFLSGGIDSSLITAVASKHLENPLKTVTLGFGEEAEYKYAKIVADHCNTDHSEIHVSSEDLLNSLSKIVWHYEFPFSRPAILAYYFLSNRTKGKLTVSLLGQGADEVFAGYNRYDAYTKFPSAKHVNNDPENKDFYSHLNQKINLNFNEKIKYLSSGVFKNDAETFFSKDALNDKNSSFPEKIKGLKNDGSQLNPTLLYEIKTELPYYQLKMVDKTSMANSHEMRVPLLDHRLVEFSLKIPGKFKFYGMDKKIILKHIAKDYLPKIIAERRKLPMVVPLSKFNKDFIKASAEFLPISRLKKMGFYNEHNIIKHVEKLKSGTLKNDNSFRQLLFFSTLTLWDDMFINN